MSEPNCTRDGCQIASTGKCLEGFDPASTCPYLPASFPADSEAEISATDRKFVDLPTGEGLTEDQAAETTREGATQLVIIAGPVGSGKTTILTSLFEAYLEAPFANYLFAGSRTLVGFERRCHDARVTSGRTVAETAHTSARTGVVFLHLKLTSAERPYLHTTNILLSDVSGEVFRILRDSTPAVNDWKALGRADHICVVIDGEKLVHPGQRHVVRNDARSFLRSLLEARVLSPSCRIHIVFSKWDLILTCQDQVEVSAFVGDTRRALERFAPSVSAIYFHKVAARPESDTLPFAHGLPTLLKAWIEKPEFAGRPRLYLPSCVDDGRQILRFATAVAITQDLEEYYDVNWV